MSHSVVFFQPALPAYRAPLFSGLRDLGLDVRVVLHRTVSVGEGQVPSYCSEASVRTWRIGSQSFFWVGGHGNTPQPAPDAVVLTWDIHYLSLIPAILRQRLRGARVILWGHGFLPGDGRGKLLVRSLIGLMANERLVYSARASQELLRNRCPSKVVGNAVPDIADSIQDVPIEHSDTTHLLCIARLQNDRGLAAAIRAMGEASREFRLTVVGEGQAASKIEEAAAEVGLELRMLGAIYDPQTLSEEFASADFFFLPEGGGLSFLHAMQHGLPVVAVGDPSKHGPEFDFLSSENSILYEERVTGEMLQTLMSLDEASQTQLQAGALKTAEHNSMTNFVTRFGRAIAQDLD